MEKWGNLSGEQLVNPPISLVHFIIPTSFIFPWTVGGTQHICTSCGSLANE